jgi:adenylate cyclase
VAERTAEALKIELLKSERDAIQERPTSSLAAYEYFLRGIQAFQHTTGFGNEGADEEAVKYFEDAIREDPEFSGAYSYLANHLIGAMGVTRSGKDVFPRARELVVKALELNPSSSDAHTAQGNLAMQMDLDWTRAEVEFQKAIALNPSASTPHFWYGFLLGVLQRFEEAREQYLRVIELDPLWLLPQLNLSGTYASLGDPDSAIALIEKLEGTFHGSPAVRAARAASYALLGRADDAIQAVEPLKGAADLMSRATRSGILALVGRPEESRALMADLDAGRLREFAPPMLRAFLHAIWGDKEAALALLEQDFREGDKLLWNSYQVALLDPIRDDPRFIAMLRAMKLPTTNPRRRESRPGREKP